MSYLGDFTLGATFDTKFTTTLASGAPGLLANSPTVVAYPDNSTTQITAGITLTTAFDGLTGLNNVRVVATGGNGYAAGTNYHLVIFNGNITNANGISLAGYVIAQFSIENRSQLRPTTAGRTLDVSATGEAGVDWANVGSPTTTVDLSGTTIAAVTGAVGSVTGTVGSVTGNVSGNVGGSVGSVTGAVGSVTGNVGGNVAGSVGSVAAGGIAAASFAANAITAASLAADAGVEIADALLDRNMGTGTDSGSTTVRTPRQAFRHIRNKWLLSTTNDLTVYKEDDSTISWTSVVTGSTSANPIIGSDPAGP